MSASEVVVFGEEGWGCCEGIEREREGESEEEMDGGGRRDVRKLRVEEVFYGAIGKELNSTKKGGIAVWKCTEVKTGRRIHRP